VHAAVISVATPNLIPGVHSVWWWGDSDCESCGPVAARRIDALSPRYRACPSVVVARPQAKRLESNCQSRVRSPLRRSTLVPSVRALTSRTPSASAPAHGGHGSLPRGVPARRVGIGYADMRIVRPRCPRAIHSRTRAPRGGWGMQHTMHAIASYTSRSGDVSFAPGPLAWISCVPQHTYRT